jgi:hypothetical protein
MATHRETSGAILIDSFGRFLFQQRDDNPQVSYPGLIGLFGGNREGNETFLECVVRKYVKKSAISFQRSALCISLAMRGLIIGAVRFTTRLLL